MHLYNYIHAYHFEQKFYIDFPEKEVNSLIEKEKMTEEMRGTLIMKYEMIRKFLGIS